ncbi:hypothetical protein F0L17_06535 [Streptomyces sp. TRM43335]|uniref:Zinc finger CGNR domain-containing protein n=1 Tax=Streptomyces taklimakanensis TaxID=2569853 RepID=A0A6G2B957_9ACTN|nr:ABATE domain-containing protein [Streptomyces taklimakanensis]MTE18797.1 hypothetical protein [Streptomyces taklimakanensis]
MSATTESERTPRPPLVGEPLALDLVNTVFIHGGLRGSPVDALTTPTELGRWLDEHAEAFPDGLAARGPATPSHLAEFRRLREALRELSRSCVAGEPHGEEAAAVVNRAARLSQRWPELAPGETAGPVVRWAEEDPYLALLGVVAVSGVDLLTGPRRRDLRACAAPGCVLYFVRSHRRREWCTPACGNRVRVARHHGRHRG